MEHTDTPPALTSLAEDEILLRDSVAEFAEAQIRPRVREMDEHAKFPQELLDQLFDLGVMGIEIPEQYGGGGGQLLSLGARGRGAVGRRPVGRRPGRRAEHAGRERDPALGLRRHQAAVPAAPGRRHGRRLRAVRGGIRERRVRAGHQGESRRRRLRAQRPQAVDHQRQRGRRLHRVRQRQPGRRLPRHHRVPGGARRPGLQRRQEGRQARHPREQHVRADPRGLPRRRVAGPRRGRQRLQGRDRDAERGAHRHRRADDRPREGRARPRGAVHEGAQAVRQAHRGVPARPGPDRPDGHRDRSRPAAGVQRRAGFATRAGRFSPRRPWRSSTPPRWPSG